MAVIARAVTVFRAAVLAVLLGCTLAVVADVARAQGWPTKPVRLVVPWGSGTPPDVVGRLVADRLAAGLGQPILVENRPGAAGTVGLAEALRQPADGYTVYSVSLSTLVAPLLFSHVGADFLKDMAPVGHLVWHYNVLVVPASSPLRGAQDLLNEARARPGQLRFGSGGNGSPAHLAGELFRQVTKTDATHVPYNQFPQAIADLVGGRLDFMFLTASAAIPQIAGGKLRPLATTGARRLPALPDVPTMLEAGFSGFEVRAFDGWMVRAGTPREIVERLNAELVKALAAPPVQERLAQLALETESMSPQQFGAMMARESERWLRIGRAAGVKAD